MFEALFILTTLDAGTRVGRYLLQEVLGHIWKPLADTKAVSANVLASLLMVAGWGWFLIQGVRDPLGGINSLWPLFGIANQLLASIALCLATTIILKMHLAPAKEGQSPRRPAYALITLLPLVWLLAVTMTAGWQKIFHADPRIGFLSQARVLTQKLPALRQAVALAEGVGDKGSIALVRKSLRENEVLLFNQYLDAVVAGAFLVLVALIVLLSAREWLLLAARKREARLAETPPVWLPGYAVTEARGGPALPLLALGITLLKELSGQADIDRAQAPSAPCQATSGEHGQEAKAYVAVTEARFQNVRRCC